VFTDVHMDGHEVAFYFVLLCCVIEVVKTGALVHFDMIVSLRRLTTFTSGICSQEE
jgi:hypothetical protein